MNAKKIERVAKAICFAARMSQEAKCPICGSAVKEGCTMAVQFEIEAIAAIREVEK